MVGLSKGILSRAAFCHKVEAIVGEKGEHQDNHLSIFAKAINHNRVNYLCGLHPWLWEAMQSTYRLRGTFPSTAGCHGGNHYA